MVRDVSGKECIEHWYTVSSIVLLNNERSFARESVLWQNSLCITVSDIKVYVEHCNVVSVFCSIVVSEWCVMFLLKNV